MAKKTQTKKKRVIRPSPYRINPVFVTGELDISLETLKNIEISDNVPEEIESLVNPLGVIEQWRAVCKTCHIYLSPSWRNSHEDADADALKHLPLHHRIGYENRYITRG